jgi:hypothetical protein
MNRPPLPELLARIEDEVAGLDSRLDARTRTLWLAIEQLRAEIAEFRKWLTELQEKN